MTPQDWSRIQQGIFKGESGGDYGALFGYQNRPGGKFANIDLTKMTIDDALEFANPSGNYGQFVKGQVGRVATPMGLTKSLVPRFVMRRRVWGSRGRKLCPQKSKMKSANGFTKLKVLVLGKGTSHLAKIRLSHRKQCRFWVSRPRVCLHRHRHPKRRLNR